MATFDDEDIGQVGSIREIKIRRAKEYVGHTKGVKEVIDATVNDDWDYFFRLGWDFPINAIEHYKLDNQAFKEALRKVHQMKSQSGIG